jgi:hypothetical protein
VAAGDVTDGKSHGEDGETESQGHAQESDSEIGEGGGQDGAAASAEDQPKGEIGLTPKLDHLLGQTQVIGPPVHFLSVAVAAPEGAMVKA